jgi:hypothetical protein
MPDEKNALSYKSTLYQVHSAPEVQGYRQVHVKDDQDHQKDVP